jgi:hypothetical protein
MVTQPGTNGSRSRIVFDSAGMDRPVPTGVPQVANHPAAEPSTWLLSNQTGGINAALYQRPPLVVRYGSAAVFAALIVFAAIACLLPYSRPVSIRVRIETTAAPMEVFSAPDRRIDQVLVKDGQTVTAGQPLVALEDPGAEDPISRRSYLRAPATGSVSFLLPPSSLWSARALEPVMVIVPGIKKAPEVFGFVPVAHRSAVRVKQRIFIQLPAYPKHKDGQVEGVIERIAAASKDGQYLISIGLPQGLRTSRGTVPELDGVVEAQADITETGQKLVGGILESFNSKVKSLHQPDK